MRNLIIIAGLWLAVANALGEGIAVRYEEAIQFQALVPGFGSVVRAPTNAILPISSWYDDQRDPALSYFNGKYFLYTMGHKWAAGGNPVLLKIAGGVSDDGTNWSVISANPVLDTNTTVGIWDSGNVFSPGTYVEGGTLFLYYTGVTNNTQNGGVGSQIGLATTTDGTNFTRYTNRALVTATHPLAGNRADAPTVVKQGDTYVMLWSGETNGVWRIFRSTAGSPYGPWTNATDVAITAPPFITAAEKSYTVKMSDTLFYVFVDSLSMTLERFDPFGTYYWTTNLITGPYNLGLMAMDGVRTNDSGGIAGAAATLRPDGKILFIYNSHPSPESDNIHDRRLFSAVLAPGLVAPPEPYKSFTNDTVNTWIRVVESPHTLNGRFRIELLYHDSDPVSTAYAGVDFYVSATPSDVASGGPAPLSNIRLMNYYHKDFIGTPLLNTIRVGIWSNDIAYVDLGVAQVNGGRLFINDSPLSANWQVPRPAPVTNGSTAMAVMPITDIARGSVEYFDGTAWQNRILYSSSGVITNIGTAWLSTNGTPTANLPNGSIATVTDGRFFVRSNSAWVLH